MNYKYYVVTFFCLVAITIIIYIFNKYCLIENYENNHAISLYIH